MIFFKFKFQIPKLIRSIIFICTAFFCVHAQSTDQSFPTAVTSNQIEGAINARDIGDSRRTSYFYTFNSTQGDIFINVVTNNFNGAIDVFNAENLQPITKIVFYAGDSAKETGRVFYLRKPEKLILRIQGRTPNDDPATFQIKFAGSFAPAVAATADNERPETPKVTKETESDIIVNSVGTIIGVKPKPTPSPAAKKEKTEKKTKTAETKKEAEVAESKTEETIIAEIKPEEAIEKTEPEKEEKTVQLIVTDPATEQKSDETIAETTEEETTEKAETVIEEANKEKETTETKKENEETEKEKKANALANINLTILLKNGDKFVRPMSEVFSVNIDDGKMTVITKDGEIKRFSIFDIAKTTIE